MKLQTSAVPSGRERRYRQAETLGAILREALPAFELLERIRETLPATDDLRQEIETLTGSELPEPDAGAGEINRWWVRLQECLERAVGWGYVV